MVPIEVWCGSGDVARANWVLHSSLPFLGGIVVNEFTFEELPCGWFAVKFRQWNLIGIALQSFRKLGNGGVRKGSAVAADGVRTGAKPWFWEASR